MALFPSARTWTAATGTTRRSAEVSAAAGQATLLKWVREGRLEEFIERCQTRYDLAGRMGARKVSRASAPLHELVPRKEAKT
jgi:hypothetical protein